MLDEAQQKLSPISESAIYILLCLFAISKTTDGIHAYGIKRWLRRYTEKAIELPPSTIYKVLDRFVAAGLATQMDNNSDSHGNEQKCYVITDAGEEMLHQEFRRVEKVYFTAKSIINGDGIKPTTIPW